MRKTLTIVATALGFLAMSVSQSALAQKKNTSGAQKSKATSSSAKNVSGAQKSKATSSAAKSRRNSGK